MHQLTESQIMDITSELSNMIIEDEARAVVRRNIQLKKDIGSYQGLRHALHLPVRGQLTKNNARTARKLNRLDRKG